MKTLTYFNEKGNALVSVRNELRKQSFAKIYSVLADCGDFESVTVSANGDIAIALAQDTNGTPIYANLSMTISTANPEIAKPKKTSGKKKAEPVEVPDLF